VGNGKAIDDESTVQEIEAIATGDLSTEHSHWETIAILFKHRGCGDWKPQSLRSHLQYILREIDRISDHLHPTTYTDGVKQQTFGGKMSVLLVVAVVTPELVLSTADKSLDSMWNQEDKDIQFVCKFLAVEDQVVKRAMHSLELLFDSLEPPQHTGRKRKPSQVLSGQSAHR